MITISKEFADDLREVIEKLVAENEITENRRAEMIHALGFLLETDEEFPDHHDAQEN